VDGSSALLFIYKKSQTWPFDGACDYLSAVRQWKLILFGIQIHHDVYYDIFKYHWLAEYVVRSPTSEAPLFVLCYIGIRFLGVKHKIQRDTT
jgi:hypothetical protein